MSKITNNCLRCNGCSVSENARSSRYGFPKRLLVATSVVVIIAMCLIPAEGRAVENRRRHQRRHPENAAHLTKDTSATLKRPKNSSIELYKNATKKITKKLRNTKRFLDQERRGLNETREYRDGMPDWLPSVNFVDIHFHDYKSSRKGGSITERKFKYLMPKLYKSLKEYEVIFDRLKVVRVEFPDAPFTEYKTMRQNLIEKTLQRLFSTIAEITENMYSVNMPIPHFDRNRLKLSSLDTKVDATQCLKNDYIAFRGYGNLLNNWYSEFRCPRNKKADYCKEFTTKLDHKRAEKRKRLRSNKGAEAARS